jgi:hypothetical protein
MTNRPGSRDETSGWGNSGQMVLYRKRNNNNNNNNNIRGPYGINRVNVECRKLVIPVIIWVNGTISKSFRKYGKNTTLRNYRQQPYFGTAHIPGKVLM